MNVSNLNKQLRGLLAALKKAEASNEATKPVDEINSILYSAILSHPTEVNAVRIKINARTETEDNWRSMRYLSRSNWDEYLRKSTEKEDLGEVVSHTFTAHLPVE